MGFWAGGLDILLGLVGSGGTCESSCGLVVAPLSGEFEVQRSAEDGWDGEGEDCVSDLCGLDVVGC